MSIHSHTVVVLALTAVSLSFEDAAAASPPNVRIVSPREGSFVVGASRLQAAVDPSDLASGVVFFVDGVKTCTVSAPPFECEWNAGPTIAEHVVRLVVNLRAGGRIVQMARTAAAAFAETVDVDVVKVTVTVTDDRGRYISGLPRSSFRVSEDGRPQTISHFFSEDAPLELVVAVDMSASMRPAMSTVKQAVAEFLGALPSRHDVTLLGFNDSVFTVAPRSSDPAARIEAVNALSAWGPTALYDAILQGADLLDAQTGRKALVVFTDGNDSGSLATIADVEQRLQASDLTLYMIGQGQGLTSAALKAIMDRLSRPTGGRAFTTERAEDLHDIFIDLLEELSRQYALGYAPTNGARDNTWRQISVDVAGYRRVRARHGYRAVPLSSGATEQTRDASAAR
jgi:Ca-activated chloride channel family protein